MTAQSSADCLTAETAQIRRGLANLRFQILLLKLEAAERKAYDPNQPRVPAGNPDGGQWTRLTSRISLGGIAFADAQGAIGSVSPVMSDASPDPIRIGAQYAAQRTRVTIDYSQALTGISTIDDTTKALSRTLAHTMQTMDFIPKWSPQQYGTAVHVTFGTAVRFQGLPGIGYFDVEHSFANGDSVRPGTRGSIRTDVVLRNETSDVIAIYDVKTGGARLEPARVRELREKTGVSASVPIIELHGVRGATLKSHAAGLIGSVIARLWAPQDQDNVDPAKIR